MYVSNYIWYVFVNKNKYSTFRYPAVEQLMCHSDQKNARSHFNKSDRQVSILYNFVKIK